MTSVEEKENVKSVVEEEEYSPDAIWRYESPPTAPLPPIVVKEEIVTDGDFLPTVSTSVSNPVVIMEEENKKLKSEIKRLCEANRRLERDDFVRMQLFERCLKERDTLTTENEYLKTELEPMPVIRNYFKQCLLKARQNEKEHRERANRLERQVAVMGIRIGELEEELFLEPLPVDTDRYMEEE
jgi:hypothetical protein